jgi:hypothetical protein
MIALMSSVIMQVYKVADIVNGILTLPDDVDYKGEIAGILLSLNGVANPQSDSAWTLEIPIENNTPIRLHLPPFVSVSDSLQEPLFLPDRQFVFFRSQLFIAESPPKTVNECSEIIAEVEKRVRGETLEPREPMPRPPGVPKGYARLWVHPEIATDLGNRYAGTDAVLVSAWDFADYQKHYAGPGAVADSRILRPTPIARRPTEPVSVEGVLYELDKLTGLTVVKRGVRSLVNYLRIQQLRKEEGLPPGQMTMHLVFTGNAGTGKTSVARLLAKIYKAMGFLPEGHLVETDRSGLVGEYLGHTAPKTLKVIQKALGGVLFIDEAYSLTRTVQGQKDMFGLEAIDTLLKAMEDNRDRLVVIVAGYPNEMKHFISSNPGLRSRFTRYIDFPDYAPDELMQIFEQQASESGYILSEGARNGAAAIFKAAYESRGEGFGNGRWVRTMFERTSVNLSDRLANDTNITRAHLITIQQSDIESILQ